MVEVLWSPEQPAELLSSLYLPQTKPSRPMSGDYATIDEAQIKAPQGAPPKPTMEPPKPDTVPPPKPAMAPPPKPNAAPPPKPNAPPPGAPPRATPAPPPQQQAYFEEVGPQQNLPPVQGTGFGDNFWNDKGGKTGFDILVLKHRNGKEVLKDLAECVAHPTAPLRACGVQRVSVS
jgi:hypothetical protein